MTALGPFLAGRTTIADLPSARPSRSEADARRRAAARPDVAGRRPPGRSAGRRPASLRRSARQAPADRVPASPRSSFLGDRPGDREREQVGRDDRGRDRRRRSTALNRLPVRSPVASPRLATTMPTSPRGTIPNPTVVAPQRPMDHEPMTPPTALVITPSTTSATTRARIDGSASAPRSSCAPVNAKKNGVKIWASGAHLVLELFLRLGLGDDEAGHERADDGGQPDVRRDERQGEHQHERGDDRRGLTRSRPAEHGADLRGGDDRLGAALDAEFLQDRRDVRLDGRLRDGSS